MDRAENSWAICRWIRKQQKKLCFRIIIIFIAPAPDLGRTIADIRIRIRIKQPEWNVNTLDLINMVLILKDLRKKPFSSQMTQKTGLCRLFVSLNGITKSGFSAP